MANFKTVILSNQKTIAVERPSVGLDITFNGENDPVYVAPAAQTVNASIKYQSNLPDKLLNPRLEARFSGNALNESSVTAYTNGFYNSGTDRVTWGLVNQEGATTLSPGDQGQVLFSFASLPDVTGKSREITIDFYLTGQPVGSTNTITVHETRTVKIASQVTLTSKVLHSTGPFKNSGPIPPQVEKETTYSVLWSVGNTQNAITDAKVTAHLGSAVKWVNSYSVNPEEISYDEGTNIVTWNLGTLNSGVGFSTPERQVAFEVALTPSLSQVGLTPTLANSVLFTGFETVAQKTINLSSPALTTAMPSDPAFIQGDDIVVK